MNYECFVQNNIFHFLGALLFEPLLELLFEPLCDFTVGFLSIFIVETVVVVTIIDDFSDETFL